MNLERFKVEIKCSNAAFGGGDAHIEVARILRELADRIDAKGFHWFPHADELIGGRHVRLRDVNGNPVGTASAYPEGE